MQKINATMSIGYASSVSGGLTTALILPGSADAIGAPPCYARKNESDRYVTIGGQAFVIKLRRTAERSPTSMLLEPPFNLNASYVDNGQPPRWRHMKYVYYDYTRACFNV